MDLQQYEKIMRFLTLEEKIKTNILDSCKHDSSLDQSWSALMLIIKHGGTYNTDTILDILIEYSNLDYKNKNGNTALMLATDHGKDKIVEKLISKGGADVNLVDNNNCTALIIATCYSLPTTIITNVVSPVLEDKNIKWVNNSTTNIERIVDLLLDNDADINKVSKDGKTALMHCIDNPENDDINFNIIKKLIERKANLNTMDHTNSTPLTIALDMYPINNQRTIDIVTMLLAYGADPDTDTYRNSPLILAIIFHSQALINIILDYSTKYTQTSLLTPELYIGMDKTNILETIKLLLDKGADINAKDVSYCTPLMYACSYCKNAEVIKLLLDRGADKKLKNIHNHTAYSICKKNVRIPIETTNLLKTEINNNSSSNIFSEFLFGD